MRVKLQKPREKHYLGQTGIVRTRGDEKNDARELFLRAVELNAPGVLQDLRKQVYDRWNECRRCRGTPIPKYLTRSIRDWARRWNLTREGQAAHWIVGQVECTFSDWVKNSKLVGGGWGTFTGSHEHRPVVHLFEISEALMVLSSNAKRGSPWERIERRARRIVAKYSRDARRLTFEMAVDKVLKKDPSLYTKYLNARSHHSQVVACMPTAYPRKQIREALRQLKADVQRVLENSNSDLQFRKYLITKPPSLRLQKTQSIDADRFVWAVRFQCLGHTYAEIAASQGINWIEPHKRLDDERLTAAKDALPAIAAGVRDILALVELTPRSGGKVGLPKRSASSAESVG